MAQCWAEHYLGDREQRTTWCPLWVISGHVQRTSSCPLYPRKRHLPCTSPCPLCANGGLGLFA